MPIVCEPSTYDEYSNEVERFKTQMDKTPDGQRRAEFSDERSKGESDIMRFVAYPDGGGMGNGPVAGWMVLKILPDSAKIEGICVDPKLRKGVAKSLVTTAV